MNPKEGIIVCSNKTKERILRGLKDFKKYTFFTIDQIINKIYGEIKKEAYYALIHKYDFSYDIACEYIKYMPYICDKYYSNEKLDSILSVKKYLIKEGLYIYDDLFRLLVKNKEISIYNLKDKKLIKKINNFFNDSNLNFIDTNNKYSPIVYEFEDIYLEALNVMNSIYELKKKGISLNKIHILNMDDEYKFIFKRLTKSYQIPIDFIADEGILSFDITKQFLYQCHICDTFNEVLSNLSSKSNIIDLIVDCIISYDLIDKKPIDCIEIFNSLFKRIKLEKETYDEMVSTEFDLNFSDDEYVFFVGCNLGNCPKIYRDEAFLNDSELELIGIATSYDRNRIECENIKDLFLSTKNIIISYKLKSGANTFYPSNIIKDLNLKVVKKDTIYGISKQEDNIRFGLAYTNYLKYNITSNALEYNINELKFNKYNNEYKGISLDLLNKYFDNNPLKLSYSSIKIFYLCPFYYYLDKIMGLNEFKSSLSIRIGKLSHHVLENSYIQDFNFNKVFFEAMNKYSSDEEKERDIFFFLQMKRVLSSLIEYNKNHENISQLNNIERELYIESDFDECSFIGFIDKLMYAEINGEIYAAIIDYKTGQDIISLDNVYDGFNLQLPSYMFLLSKYPKFTGKKIHIVGIYLQKINLIAIDNTLDLTEQLEKSFRLRGYSVKDGSILALLDPNYSASDYIQSMMIKKDGNFGAYAKVITEKDCNRLIDIVNDLIIKAAGDIKKGNFRISPKRIADKNVSCVFCNYKDICFKKYTDEVELIKKDFFEAEVKKIVD
ncbi:MAG: PD-(D/E)XK nuclease family protein [Anaeroplasma sp.]